MWEDAASGPHPRKAQWDTSPKWKGTMRRKPLGNRYCLAETVNGRTPEEETSYKGTLYESPH